VKQIKNSLLSEMVFILKKRAVHAIFAQSRASKIRSNESSTLMHARLGMIRNA